MGSGIWYSRLNLDYDDMIRLETTIQRDRLVIRIGGVLAWDGMARHEYMLPLQLHHLIYIYSFLFRAYEREIDTLNYLPF